MKMISRKIIKTLDPGIRPLILFLNEKGYKTGASCSGHPKKDKKEFCDMLFKKVLKRMPSIKRSEFNYEWSGYIAFINKSHPKIIKNMLKESKIYPKLRLATREPERAIEFNFKKLSKERIDAIWNDAYQVLKDKL